MLGPEAFGLYAFVFAISGFVSIIGAFSLGLALIQSREESQELYDTALAITVGLGLASLLPAFWLLSRRALGDGRAGLLVTHVIAHHDITS